MPGDRYITASEAAKLFNISQATANRAMALLAEREVLLRSRYNGTFVGPKVVRPATVDVPTVYVLMAGHALKSIHADEALCALRQAIGGDLNVQFCFLHDGDPLTHIRSMIKSAHDSGGRFGIIVGSNTREVYQLLLDQAVPSVALGTPFAGQDDLPSIDHDHTQGGRLLADYLIRRGHDRMVMLMPIDARPGDADFLGGITDAMSEAGRPANALRVPMVPRDASGITAEVERLMTQPDRATGLIATSEQIGRITIDAASNMGLAVPGDVEVVFNNRQPEKSPLAEHTQLHHPVNLEQMCQQAGAMLDRLWHGLPLEQKHVVIPAELCERQSIEDHTVH